MIAIFIIVFTGILLLFTGILKWDKIHVPLCTIGLLSALIACFVPEGSLFSEYDSMFRFTTYAQAFSVLLILSTLLICLLSGYFLKEDIHYKSDKLTLMVFSLSGAITMVASQNLLMLFLGIEILSIPLYILAASQKDDLHSNEAGMKYFLMGSFATGILLFGMALIYGACGSTEIIEISTKAIDGTLNKNLMQVGIVMVLIALLFKVGAAPFHFWAPDVYDGTPTLFTAYMSTVVKTSAFAAFFLLFANALSSLGTEWKILVAIASALTLLIGNITAVNQSSFKRLMAYSSISHAGYLLMSLLSNNIHQGQSALLLYLTAYCFASIGAFSIFIVLQKQNNRSDLAMFNGLGSKYPLLSVAMTIFMLSMAGIPLTAGFFGKYYLFSIAFAEYKYLVLIAILAAAVSIYYYFKVVINMWFHTADTHIETVQQPILYSVVMVLCAFATIVIGIFPSLVIECFW